jgi:hypothetical protein
MFLHLCADTFLASFSLTIFHVFCQPLSLSNEELVVGMVLRQVTMMFLRDGISDA